MIVISKNLVATEPETFGADNPLIGWHNIVTPTNVSADTEDANNPVVNLANASTYQKWIAGSAIEQYVTITTGEEEPEVLDYLAIARHNLGSAQIVASVEINSSAGIVEVANETLLPDDGVTIFRFSSVGSDLIRLRLQAGSAPPQIGVMFVGRILTLQRRIYVGHTPIVFGRRANITNGRSETGNFLGRIQTGESYETSIDPQNLTPDWYREYMAPFIEASATGTFFFSWRPSTYPLDVGYCWFTDDPRPSNQRANGMMRVPLNIAGIIE